MSDFEDTFAALREVFKPVAKRLHVLADTPQEYALETKVPSPFKQHKGKPLWFGAVRIGKAYVSLHLMPLYMNPKLMATVSPELMKRMQGKACFNFKTAPDAALVKELKGLATAGLKSFEGLVAPAATAARKSAAK